MVVLTKRPTCPIPRFARLSELYVEPEGKERWRIRKSRLHLSRKSLFLWADSALKLYERLPWKPGRRLAWRRTERWIVAHQEADGSWGGIMLPWLYSLLALKCLGYSLDHPVMKRGLEGLESFILEDRGTFRMQPATSPVWDTAWSVIALREAGVRADHPSLVRAASWLKKKEIRVRGDWRVKNSGVRAGGWAFEFENDLYPDIDDTAVVARALRRVVLEGEEESGKRMAVRRGVSWIAGMQSDNGGWAAFDKNNNKKILTHIPFADFMTPLDPTSPDVTAHVVELLGELLPATSGREGAASRRGVASGRGGASDEAALVRAALARALAYLEKTQESDGSWYGRWGVNYIYGTGLVLACLRAAGLDMRQPNVSRAVSWLKTHQNGDGGWGETCRSYEEPGLKGQGPSTFSQTAWALLGLLAAGEQGSRSVAKGLEYLLAGQNREGSWEEEAFTGTGFPRAFYLRYDLYRLYFPLMALGRYLAEIKETR
jgi:squalene-hopene/tetraprenyl-beta-curcumene cyclase